MLTDLQCRKAKPRDKPYKLSDALGLYLHVSPTGFRSWRMKYRTGEGASRKEVKLTFGPYPEVSLEEARAKRDSARRLLREGIDPAVDRKQRSAAAAIASANTFEAAAREWHEVKKPTWAPRYAQQILDRLEADVFPAIGRLPITAVTPALVLQTIRAIEGRGALEMAHVVRQHISGVFVYAIGAGMAADDPAHAIRSALRPKVAKLQPAFLKLDQARKVLTRTEELDDVYCVTLLASRLLALTVVRPGVLRLAEPEEFEALDGPEPLWRIPAAKMKLSQERKADAGFEFVVPLSRQAVATVNAAIGLAGKRPLLFPSVRFARRPISDSTLSCLYRRAGFAGQHVPHGWRATFSTVMNELAAKENRVGDRAIIDLMLAHVPDGVEAAYNRAAYMPRRRELAQEWADLLMEGVPPASSLLRR